MGASLSRAVCVALGVTYPAYASFKALEGPRAQQEEKQWLTYWVVYGACTSMETAAERLVNWLPGYYVAKTLLLVWMMLPQTKGALIVYRSVVRPLLKKYEPSVDRQLRSAQHTAEDFISSLTDSGSQLLAKQLEAMKQSEVFVKIGQALRPPASAPDADTTDVSDKKEF